MGSSHGFTKGQRGGGGIYYETAPAGWQPPALPTRASLKPEECQQIAVVSGLISVQYAILPKTMTVRTWNQVWQEAYVITEQPHPAIPVTKYRLENKLLVRMED